MIGVTDARDSGCDRHIDSLERLAAVATDGARQLRARAAANGLDLTGEHW